MRTIDVATTIHDDETTISSVAAGIHEMIAGFRCAGTGRLVKSGVSMTHMHVLWLLEHHGELHMGHLADFLDVSMSNTTGIVDRMQERGLVERERPDDDRRVVVVRLAAGGRQALDAMEAVKQDRVQGILRHLDRSQLERIAGALHDIEAAVTAELGPDFGAGHDHPHNADIVGRESD
ncbi:MAG: MarR family winged helix-turn-helix transcriptional regulator [Chloroflexota bacterium]